MDKLWLGYDGLNIPFGQIVAVMRYRRAWDRHILRTYGRIPANIRAVVVTDDGSYYPAGRTLEDLHARWAAWRQQLAGEHGA
ncbi:MAG: hypothetical protein KatS3mg057_1228 [Herpetosiphonaceae bacterium]|nr:MAG: hypothetical protein KatS3mg057_1228 [Herpetosiphonaceae bacterium]